MASTTATMTMIDAAAKKKRIFDLAVPLEIGMPSSGAHPNFQMGLVRRHGDRDRPGAGGGTSANELLTMGAHVGTHVDALGHWAVNGRIHGDIDAVEATRGGRFRQLGADKIEPMVCRGVLLDIPALLGLGRLPPGYGITARELEQALGNVTLRAGDVALIRTGWQQLYQDHLAFHGGEDGVPGVTGPAAEWLAQRGVRVNLEMALHKSSGSAALLIGKIAHARKEWEALSTIARLKEYGTGSRQEFLKACQSEEFDDVVVIFRSNASTSVTGPFNQELVSKLPSSLKYICHNGAGYDNIDVDACSRRGILISSTPVVVNNATADIAIFLMIGALRQAHKPLSGIREGRWRGDFTLGHDPSAKILGILGMGGIGREVAIRAQAFGMKIRYHNRHPLQPEHAVGAEYVSFDDLISQSDVISLNLSLTQATRHVIGAPEFAKMKDGVVLINTARGTLIDEKALVDALESGKVYSAGLDVYEDEPKVHAGLLGNPNVFLLPHIGTATYETQKEMELLVLKNVQMAVKERKLLTPIAEQKSVAQ